MVHLAIFDTICDDVVLGYVIQVVTTVLTIFQYGVPLLLIAGIIISLVKAVINPDDPKRNVGTIPKRALAAILCFMTPFLVELVLGWVPETTNFGTCWATLHEKGDVIGTDFTPALQEDHLTKQQLLEKYKLPDLVNSQGSCQEFQQADSKWGSSSFSTNNIASCGCGPTAVAIALSCFGSSKNPKDVVAVGNTTGLTNHSGCGSYGTGICPTVKKMMPNLFCDAYGKSNLEALKSKLSKGAIAVVFVQEPNAKTFSVGGQHFITATGIRKEGGKTQIYIANPNNGRAHGWVDEAKFNSSYSAGWVIYK